MDTETDIFSGIPLQSGMQLQTENYQEKLIHYGDIPILYYHFMTSTDIGIPILPDGCIDILFECSTVQPSAWICGSVLTGEMIPFRARTVYFGVRLPMGASLSVERMPFRETLNQRLSLVDAIPRTGSAGTAITEASAFSQRINVFEQQLLPLILDGIQVPEMINQCLYYMIRTGGHSSIENLAGQIGYTSRYIRKKFDDYMGISPKQISRIIRFQQVLHHLVVLGSWDYDQSGINGYYDQSHFLKEFKQFTMLTPAQFLHAVRTNPTYNNA